MDELEISGRRYLSTRRAAREHGYHSDYMGQLIRGKKVDGQKVGRAWYIDEESLAAYLGKAPAPRVEVQPEPVPAPIVEKEPQPEPIVEPASTAQHVVSSAPEPEPVLHVPEVQEISQPIVAEEKIEIKQEPQVIEVVQPTPEVQKVEISQETVEPAQEDQETKIPIHIPREAIQDIGGLRYSPDDSPSLPVVVRMPRQSSVAQPGYTVATPSMSRFPVVSLSIVGLLALGAAIFASNFVTVTVVSEQGKAATVQYAIHW